MVFGADMSTSTHIDNKEKDTLVFGRGPTQGLESTLTAEKIYSINFTVTIRLYNEKSNNMKKTGLTGYVYDLVLIIMLLHLMILKAFIII